MDPGVHLEIPYDDAKRMIGFYQSAFGWRLQQLGAEMGRYVIATTAETQANPGAPAGVINGGFFACKPNWPGERPSVVIAVRDIRTSIDKVRQAGGEVLGEPTEIPGIGLYVAFYDSERNRCSMLEPSGEM
jgi:predicted enzyme related to lactoylglutathione lyase